MIDIVKQPYATTIECKLDDLPIVLREKISLHLFESEEILVCMVTKHDIRYFETYVITPYRVARINAFIANKATGEIKTDGYRSNTSYNEDSSLLLNNYTGHTHYERESVGEKFSTRVSEFNLTIHGTSHSIKIQVGDKEMFDKFVRILASAVKKTLNK